jgi:enoyl-CoA hydratase/carnithine racemase
VADATQNGVLLQIDGQVATVTLNRPEKLNALTLEMLGALAEIATQLDADRVLRCVILTAAGERAFCVGADINAWSALEPLDMWRSWVKRGHQVFDQWARLRQPVIAAINGHALGGGLELAAGSSPRCTRPVRCRNIDRDLSSGRHQRLAALVGISRVKYLALARPEDGRDEAHRIGFVHELAGADRVLAAAQGVAADICRLAPVSVQHRSN